MGFRFIAQRIPELLLVETDRFADDRGAFAETYREQVFCDRGLPRFMQDNQSQSRLGVIRGLHFQNEPHAVAKLVRCVRGRIFDVAVDIRRLSPTYGEWVSAELSEENGRMFFVPAGFAHGFCAVSETADVLYRQSGYYAPDCDRAIRFDDPTIGVAWPAGRKVLSAKDAAAPLLTECDNNLVYRGGSV